MKWLEHLLRLKDRPRPSREPKQTEPIALNVTPPVKTSIGGDGRLGLLRAELARKLSSTYRTWTLNGESVDGPGTLAVRVEDQHPGGPNHFDIHLHSSGNARTW